MPEKVVQKRVVPLQRDRIESLLESIDLSNQGITSWQELKEPLQRSLAYVKAQPSERLAVQTKGLRVSWQDLEDSLNRLLNLLPLLDKNKQLLIKHFQWYELRAESLITGYFEPQIKGSLTARPDYPCPIYGLPRDLRVADLGRFHPRWEGERLIYRIENGHIQPYYGREAIEKDKALEGKAEILAWAKDPVDLFFLQIQGSGVLLLPDGQKQYIGYAGKNGRRYVSLGRVLARQEGLNVESISMQSIQNYLNQHQELLPEILYTNPSYVFFRLREDGPYGAIGRKLTPLVSLAADPSLVALGSLVIYSVDLPVLKREGTLSVVGLGLIQDIGGAVKGHHFDLFCGSGKKARYRAGHLKDKGSVYVLLAREENS